MKERDEINLSDVVAEAERDGQSARYLPEDAYFGQDSRANGSDGEDIRKEKRAGKTSSANREEKSAAGTASGDREENGADKKRGFRMNMIFGGDKALWIVIVTLLVVSMLLALSATVYKSSGTPLDKLLGQLGYIALGIAGLLLVHFIRYQFYIRIANVVFIAGLLLTLAALVFGPQGADARRDLPIFGIPFQPFEVLKIGLIMLLAKRLGLRQKNIENTPIMFSFNPGDWRGSGADKQWDIIRKQTIPILLPIILACAVTFFAVGNSTTLIIAATCFVMLYISRVKMSDLFKIVAIAALFGAPLLLFSDLARSETGRSRISKFNPDIFTKHAYVNDNGIEVYGYPASVKPSENRVAAEASQSINAKMSIASGGFFGKGPGMSTHRSNLEEADKDFAYAFIIEEYGAVGGLLLLLLYLWLFFRAIEIFKRCGYASPSLLVLGLGLMITLQAMIHMMVSVALFPITGQQLPLISKGGSSLVFTLGALGMILGVSRQTANRTLDAPKDQSLFEK